jgi:hypothetical protein
MGRKEEGGGREGDAAVSAGGEDGAARAVDEIDDGVDCIVKLDLAAVGGGQ